MNGRDLNQGLLRVEQSVVKVGGRVVVAPPKPVAGARTAAPDETCRRLHWHAARQRLDIHRATAVVGTHRGDASQQPRVER